MPTSRPLHLYQLGYVGPPIPGHGRPWSFVGPPPALSLAVTSFGFTEALALHESPPPPLPYTCTVLGMIPTCSWSQEFQGSHGELDVDTHDSLALAHFLSVTWRAPCPVLQELVLTASAPSPRSLCADWPEEGGMSLGVPELPDSLTTLLSSCPTPGAFSQPAMSPESPLPALVFRVGLKVTASQIIKASLLGF